MKRQNQYQQGEIRCSNKELTDEEIATIEGKKEKESELVTAGRKKQK